jgi:hypothetical protein
MRRVISAGLLAQRALKFMTETEMISVYADSPSFQWSDVRKASGLLASEGCVTSRFGRSYTLIDAHY